ncbi:MAG: hypothetical protein KatS3mg096_607 [Candidatus Parcubacteria bacterium]|nr:MAG: hypothetical protein KatS3mg096_607 [Candidatus Parcubacteria bacterium]
MIVNKGIIVHDPDFVDYYYNEASNYYLNTEGIIDVHGKNVLIFYLPRINNTFLIRLVCPETGDIIAEREVNPMQRNRVMFHLPNYEKAIIMQGYKKGDKYDKKNIYYSLHEVDKAILLKEEDWEFYEFVFPIVRYLKDYEIGTYLKSEKGTYSIKISDYIYQNNKPILANAGVNVHTGEFIISKINMLNKFTCHERFAIMCHEYGHFYGNDKLNIHRSNEIGADLYGMKLFMDLKFHPYDYIAAFEKVYSIVPSKTNKLRLETIYKFAYQYYKDIKKREVYAKIRYKQLPEKK